MKTQTDLSQELISIHRKWKVVHVNIVPLACSLGTVEMPYAFGKEPAKKMSDISETRQRRWLLFLTVKNFGANSDWNIEEQKPKAWVENDSYAIILPSVPWTPNSRS